MTTSLAEVRSAAATGPPSVLELYDRLPVVVAAELSGSWHGTEIATGHPLDGLLGPLGWHGKRFTASGDAHPLVFGDGRGRFEIDPAFLPVGTLLRAPAVARALARPPVGSALRLLRTSRPRARVHMAEYRGVVTATMTYDRQPISDHFRRLDADTLLGVMDLRGADPYVFVLQREDENSVGRGRG